MDFIKQFNLKQDALKIIRRAQMRGFMSMEEIVAMLPASFQKQQTNLLVMFLQSMNISILPVKIKSLAPIVMHGKKIEALLSGDGAEVCKDKDIYEIYRHELEKFKPLSENEEQLLLRQFKLGKDEEAKAKLVNHNLRFAVSIAKRFTNHGLDFMDLIQEANLGLLKAIEKYDIDNFSDRLLTYAGWWIWQGVGRALQDRVRIIRFPVHIEEIVKNIKKLCMESDNLLSNEEIAAQLNLSIEKVCEIQRLIGLSMVSLDGPLSNDDSDLTEQYEVTANHSQLDAEQSLIAKEEFKESRRRIETFLGKLKFKDEREKGIFYLRYGINGGLEKMILDDIGQKFSVTRERIRQIVEKIYKNNDLDSEKFEPWLKDEIDRMLQLQDLVGEEFEELGNFT